MKSYIKKSRQSNGSNLLHLYALCIKMSKKGSLRDFEGGIVPDRLLLVFQKLMIYLDFGPKRENI